MVIIRDLNLISIQSQRDISEKERQKHPKDSFAEHW